MTDAVLADREGQHTLEDLFRWDDSLNEGMLALFDKYQGMKAKIEEDKFEKSSGRIIGNALKHIEKASGILPTHVFIDDNNQKLMLLFVFKKADFDTKSDEIYKAMPRVQALALKNETMDFQWSLMDDEGFTPCLPLLEFSSCLPLSEASA